MNSDGPASGSLFGEGARGGAFPGGACWTQRSFIVAKASTRYGLPTEIAGHFLRADAAHFPAQGGIFQLEQNPQQIVRVVEKVRAAVTGDALGSGHGVIDDDGQATGRGIEHGERLLRGPDTDIGRTKEGAKRVDGFERMRYTAGTAANAVGLRAVAKEQPAERMALLLKTFDSFREQERILLVSEAAGINADNLGIGKAKSLPQGSPVCGVARALQGMKKLGVHAQWTDFNLSPWHAKKANGDFGAVRSDGVAFFRSETHDPSRNRSCGETSELCPAPDRRGPRGQRKHGGVVVASGEKAVTQRDHEARGIERNPSDRRRDLHDVRGYFTELRAQAGHPHVPEDFLVAENMQREAIHPELRAGLPFAEEACVGTAEGFPAVVGKQVRG